MIDVMQVADRADMIINGYAFTKDDNVIRVLNLNSPDKAVLMDMSGDVLETYTFLHSGMYACPCK